MAELRELVRELDREQAACVRATRDAIGRALRSNYDPILSTDLPNHLAELVERLDQAERGGKPDSK